MKTLFNKQESLKISYLPNTPKAGQIGRIFQAAFSL